MKALILAAGRGKRLGKASEGLNKCMIDAFGKPLIEYSLDCASSLNEITEIVIVVGYRAEDIINKYGNSYRRKRIKYVIQWEQKGLVDAIEWAKPAINGDDFMLMLGDEFMVKPRHGEMIEKFKGENLFAVCGVIRVSDTKLIRKTYAIEYYGEKITGLVEKPAKPANDYMGTGNCIFKNDILNYIGKTPPNPNRHEKELPDMIQCAVNAGNDVHFFPICERYVNLNSLDELKILDSSFSHL